MTQSAHSRQKGLALVSVLWTLSILSLIAAVILSSSALSYRAQRNAADRAEADRLLEAGLARAYLGISDKRPDARWRVDGVAQNFTFEKIDMTIHVQDELGKTDLNQADGDVLRRLLSGNDIPSEQADTLVDRILDWRERGSLKRLNGAKEPEYRAAGLSYGPRNGPFQSLRELKLVLGITRQIYDRISPALTVYSQRPMFDNEVAPKEMLLALPGVDKSKANQILAERLSQSPSVLGARKGVINPAISLAGRAFAVTVDLVYKEKSYQREAVIRITDDPNNPYWILDVR